MNECVSFTQLADKLLTVCGTGNVIITGLGSAECARHFWHSNVPAKALATLPDFFTVADEKADTLLCLGWAFEEASSLMERLCHASPHYVGVFADLTLGATTSPAQGLDSWVKLFVEAGFRRHPREFHSLSYEDREHPPQQCLIFFERIPEAALRKYDMQTLQEARILHMDMLREAGRRGDAHIARYFYASSFIRPGDTVLDCACGLGYGSHILYHNSRAARTVGVDLSDYAVAYAQCNYAVPGVVDYIKGNAQNLAALPDNSVDFIAGFETIEHVPEPDAYLRELFRVLRPAGRVMLSAPDTWADETGNDPNPHHFHVYTWEKLYAEVDKLFIPEKRFVQKAGGAFRLPEGPRRWFEAPCEPGVVEDGEWCLITAMKDPLLGRGVPYVETTFPHTDSPAYHVCAFDKDYINPWLLKGTISMGFRLENAKALASVQERVLAEYPRDSVDYGASLCGKTYMLLSADRPGEESDQTLTLIEDYAAIAAENPHVLRWQVSLLFAAGLLLRNQGRLSEAESFFMRCAERDVAPYSPLLGNKTLDSLFFAAKIAVARGDIQTAETRLRLALKEAIRLARGDWLNIVLHTDTPLEPGFPEMAQLMDKAARACYALGELGTAILRPGLAYSTAKGWYEAQAEYAHASIAVWEKEFYAMQRNFLVYSEEYANAAKERDAVVAERNATIAERDAAVAERDAAVAERDATIAERDAAVAERDAAVAERDAAVAERDAAVSSYENSNSWKLTAPLRKVMVWINSVGRRK